MTTSTVFYEGDHVDYLGDGRDGLPPAQGKILARASRDAVHVQWLSGERTGGVDLVSVFDLEKSASAEAVAAPTVSAAVLVRQTMKREGSAGVLQYLSAIGQLGSWEDIARDVVAFVEMRIRCDASMDLPYETLPEQDINSIISMGARTLLRDAFSGEGS